MNNNPSYLNPNHPNYERWKRARNISQSRGEFVKTLISKVSDCKNLKVLDFGSGEGGTSSAFSKDNSVISFDISLEKLERQKHSENTTKICGDDSAVPFRPKNFDIIILQDVIEHITDNQLLPKKIYELLSDEGIVYLSTPNKFSILNFLADPHWGLPFVSIMNRRQIKKYVLKYFRKADYSRTDIAELLSLREIKKHWGERYELNLLTTRAVDHLLQGNKGIVWSNFHLFIIKFINKFRLNKIIRILSNDRQGVINKIFTPTFYILLIKK